jgi:hypothetical protein
LGVAQEVGECYNAHVEIIEMEAVDECKGTLRFVEWLLIKSIA